MCNLKRVRSSWILQLFLRKTHGSARSCPPEDADAGTPSGVYAGTGQVQSTMAGLSMGFSLSWPVHMVAVWTWTPPLTWRTSRLQSVARMMFPSLSFPFCRKRDFNWIDQSFKPSHLPTPSEPPASRGGVRVARTWDAESHTGSATWVLCDTSAHAGNFPRLPTLPRQTSA